MIIKNLVEKNRHLSVPVNCFRKLLDQLSSAVVMLKIIGAGKITDRDSFGAGGVDHLTVSDKDAHMRNACPICILEKYKITGP